MTAATATELQRDAAPDAFVFALKPIYAAYLDAQEALASDDLGLFHQATEDLQSAIGFVEEAGLLGTPLATWRRAAARLLIDESITDIEVARRRFEGMSDAVISLLERFGHWGSQTWHVAYCPMAFDDAGAEWLQRGSQINNPYFGSSMLRCGEIRREFQPLNAAHGYEQGDHDHE